MATRPDIDDDDDFSQIYKEYTGPPGSSTANNTQDRSKANKRSHAGSDEEDEPRDPNAVPTDFTSREAKVWEAKSKATERNWKKRKEEEMICKICGESGHFTQGCPSTLGANRKSQDFFERVPAREKHVKALFTEKVIQRIEKDIGCKLKMEEKFLIVSGKDRLILAKGVDAVHKVIKGDGDHKGSSSSHRSRSRSPERSPVGSRLRRSESQRSYTGQPRDTSQYQQRFGRQDKILEDRVREDLQKFSRGSPQAYGNDGGRSRSSHSKSPAHPPYASNSYGSYDGHSHTVGYRNDGWDTERQGPDLQSGRQFEYATFPQTLEELELEFNREAMELGRIRDKDEDEENIKHREIVREMRENYMKKLAILRGTHARQWEEFLQLDAQRRQQQARQQMPASGFSGYKQPTYSDYDSSSANPHYSGAGLPMESRTRYSNHVENYPSRPHDNYGEFQRQRREDFGKAYNRY
ncbi:uncharacterized protein LOC8267309 isoform X2 [Ricinus communis]|uniref:uncharacterized protein LOC8267309 isoform X2 n=1 Tax=Ricinus communis TaxID=3988 RepID=UPI0007724073|nr:uncharacterized protein LOC8267309 isoform X2 [Ricinus communis]|eukprot:XP_015572440.1 uncharacterized protein LOC8267309 isoform X2 [Ricinus communis]